jgi:O-antigen/teichoic acid export membrane protein
MGASTTGASGVFAGAVIGSNICQVGWLAAADRVMSSDAFGAVLAAQALYAVLQIVIDSGTAYHGARLAASHEITSEQRDDLIRMRAVLALACAAAALAVAGLGSSQFLAATSPYVAALLIFSMLNWWEPYGRGRVGPYAGYLFGRSAGLMVVAGGIYLAGGRFPVEIAGLVECGVLVLVMIAFRLRPRRLDGLRPSPAAPWRAVFDIGLPAAISQYNFAAGVVVLGLAGQNAAAAVVAVGARLLSGVVGFNGTLASAVFPRIAGGARWSEGDKRAAGLALSLVSVVSCTALALTMLAAPLLVRAFLRPGIPGGLASVVIMVAAGAATTITLHLTSVLVASRFEKLIRTAAVIGAAVITGGAAVAATRSDVDAVKIVVSAFLVAQILTALLLALHARRRTPFPKSRLHPAVAMMIVASGLGLVGGLDGSARLPSAIVLSALVILTGASPVATAVRIAVNRMRGAPPGSASPDAEMPGAR